MTEWQPDYPLSGTPLHQMEEEELDYLVKTYSVDLDSAGELSGRRYWLRYGGETRPFQIWVYAGDGRVTDIIEMSKFGRVEARAELPQFCLRHRVRSLPDMHQPASYAIKDGDTWITARRPVPTPPEKPHDT